MDGTEVTIAQPNGAVQAQQPANDLNSLMAMALTSKEVTPEKLAALFDLKARVDARDAERQFNIDFAAAMDEMPKVIKRGKIDMREKGSIAFATYEDVDAAVRPVEQRHGFVRSFSTEPTQNGITVTLVLRHKSGHQITSTRFMPPDSGAGRNGSQATGSAESYCKRYLTNGVWNIVTVGQDNDGKTAEPISKEQADDINSLISELGMDADAKKRFLKFAEADSVAKIQRHNYERCLKALEQKRRQG